MHSLVDICQGCNQAMVYGWTHCQYEMIADFLKIESENEHFPLQQIYNNSVGDFLFDGDTCSTLEGRKLNVLRYERANYQEAEYQHGSGPILEQQDIRRSLQRECKAAITNLVLENYKRNKEGLPLIPVLFAIDIDGNTKPLRVDRMTSKEHRFNDQFTHKELRRAYKLCTHENTQVCKVACETFKFIKLKHLGNNEWDIELIDPPWSHPQFAEHWTQRKQLSHSAQKADEFNWRKQLAEQISRYEVHTVVEGDKKRKAEDEAVDGEGSAPPAKKARLEEADVEMNQESSKPKETS
jgi:hypothetical protein